MSFEEQRQALVARVKGDFTYHPPEREVVRALHSRWNDLVLELAMYAASTLPFGRHLSQTLSDLEMARMRGNQAIALGQEQVGE